MKTREQRIIEKQKELIAFYELQFNVNMKQRNNGYRLRSELSALEREGEKEKVKRGSRKEKIFDFVVKHKTDCYRAFKICNTHKGFNTKEGSLLIEMARNEIGYSLKTWDGDIYNVIWRFYKAITIDGVESPDKMKVNR